MDPQAVDAEEVLAGVAGLARSRVALAASKTMTRARGRAPRRCRRGAPRSRCPRRRRRRAARGARGSPRAAGSERCRAMKCWSTTTPRKKPSPSQSSTLRPGSTVKSPSPVIISALWQAVPAEVPPTTAPRAKAAAIARRPGVPRRASSDPRPGRRRRRRSRAPLRAPLDEVGARGVGPAPDVERRRRSCSRTPRGRARRSTRRCRPPSEAVGMTTIGASVPAGQLDELPHHLGRLVAAADQDEVALRRRRPGRAPAGDERAAQRTSQGISDAAGDRTARHRGVAEEERGAAATAAPRAWRMHGIRTSSADAGADLPRGSRSGRCRRRLPRLAQASSSPR